MKWINRIKEKYENSYIKKNKDLLIDNKLLRKRIEELEENYKPLINLKNIYLAELRVKNLENGRLRRKLEKLSKYMLECEVGNILFTGLNYREVKDIIGGK
ncbi:MAG: hypothetical protein IIZ67_04870 [Bacilli bacterium]|nr:hypothetical protein [Bacilli bacterium]